MNMTLAAVLINRSDFSQSLDLPKRRRSSHASYPSTQRDSPSYEVRRFAALGVLRA